MPSCIIRAFLTPALFHKQITLITSEYFETLLVCFIKATIMFHMKEDIPYIKSKFSVIHVLVFCCLFNLINKFNMRHKPLTAIQSRINCS